MRTKESERERSRQRRLKKAAIDGRELRSRSPAGFGMTREERVLKRRNDRAAKALKEGRDFKPRKLCDAHVKAFLKHMKKLSMELVGPPKPSQKLLGTAAYRRWLYRASASVRDYQIGKRMRYVENVSMGYARERLGVINAPSVLVEAACFHLRIKRLLKEKHDAKHS